MRYKLAYLLFIPIHVLILSVFLQCKTRSVVNNDNSDGLQITQYIQRGTDDDNTIDDDEYDIIVSEDIQLDSILIELIPAPLDDRSEQLLVRSAYVLSYNKDWKLPNWVAWHLTAEHADGEAPRSNNFREDTDVPAPRATPADYKGSGWSRGHMCPSGDNKWSQTANDETFIMTNICPQDASHNSGIWNSIEMDCRKWAKKYGDIFIVCGPLPLRGEYETIGPNKVAVPKAFFKVILCLNGKPKGFGFVTKNNPGQKKNDLYYNSISEVERLTGIDFFTLLPDSIQEYVEANADINEW